VVTGDVVDDSTTGLSVVDVLAIVVGTRVLDDGGVASVGEVASVGGSVTAATLVVVATTELSTPVTAVPSPQAAVTNAIVTIVSGRTAIR
jgi:hypothetical protein